MNTATFDALALADWFEFAVRWLHVVAAEERELTARWPGGECGALRARD